MSVPHPAVVLAAYVVLCLFIAGYIAAGMGGR